MAIGYARIEFVKRSSGKTACAKAAYNSRTEIEFQGNKAIDSQTYSWSFKEKPLHHEVLLPQGVDESFRKPSILWNAAEAKEVKSNSQVAVELVLALPDDKEISNEDRIELARSFVQEHFVAKGLAVQLDIHPPERKIIFTRENQELGITREMIGNLAEEKENLWTIHLETGNTVTFNPQEFTGYTRKEHNRHAHALVTTRRFKINGVELEDHKARDLMPRINRGKVISGPDWGKLWTEAQNKYFQERGLELKVDHNSIIPQEHLGPFRMRGRSFDLLEEHHRRIEANVEEMRSPDKILNKIVEHQSIFTKEDVERFLQKHAPLELLSEMRDGFWKQKDIIPLVNKSTGELTGKFTSQNVIEEEQKILRLADRLASKEGLHVGKNTENKLAHALNGEQKEAFKAILSGKRLACIQGYAGTGKSYLLAALRESYESAGYRVRAFGPDNATADVLKEKGFTRAENVYRFLFKLKNDQRKVDPAKEVWVLDEVGKLGNRPFLEMLKQAESHKVQVVLAGDAAQLPPVERGGMFKVFCERYGSQVLEEIQRQKTDKQRQIAKNLASGEFGAALDKLFSSRNLRWSETKKESMESLITHWAQDTRAFAQSSTLIIAHSNAEMRILNEMVRLVRKSRGELNDREFACESTHGKLFVSVGDRIEFRKNDKEIGVTNGLSGTLIEAEPDRFVVSVRDNTDKAQIISFNPQEYHAYQLGYATTYHRSQGKTIDRAYVLHGKRMAKEMFYVGLTRHVDQVYYYVSKEEAFSLSDLKRQTLRTSAKETSLDYTTHSEIESQKKSQEKQDHIQQLKNSDSTIDKIKGYGISAWDTIRAKTEEIHQRFQDRSPNEQFFNPVRPSSIVKAEVVEVIPELSSSEMPTEYQAIASNILTQEEKISLDATGEKMPFFDNENRSVSIKSSLLENRIQKRPEIWNSLGIQKQQVVRNYFDVVEKASTLRTIVEVEQEGGKQDISFSPRFQEWQEICGQRNASAYGLLETIPAQDLKGLFSNKNLSIIQDQSHKHRLHLDRTSVTGLSLEEQLREHIEPLLYRLFPDGPTSRQGSSYRFGQKGSLSVVHSGAKTGQFYDFEKQEGGGLLKLAQKELGLGKIEVQNWAKEFLGTAEATQVPKSFSIRQKSFVEKHDWVAQLPSEKCPAPAFEQLKGKHLHLYYDEVARHAYHDEGGKLLYYVLRLQDKKDPSKKIVPPLSFGYWKSQPEKPCWELKGFQQQKVLYNLHLLQQNPKTPVLVVEGEKTADKALEKLPKESFVVVTWPQGAGAVHRADWRSLEGREVLIWPDNDRAGFQAGDNICQELRKVGVKSLQIVDPAALQRHFPEKWDLADPLPSGVDDKLVKKLLLSAQHKAIDPQQLLNRLGSKEAKNPLEKAKANEILWRVDERLRASLEKRYGDQFWKINDEILKEAAGILKGQDKWRSTLAKQCEVQGAVLEKLSFQASLYETREGRKPKMAEIDAMKTVIREHTGVTSPRETNKEAVDLAFQKELAKICETALGAQMSKQQKNLLSQRSPEATEETSKQIERNAHVSPLAKEQKIIQPDRGHSL